MLSDGLVWVVFTLPVSVHLDAPSEPWQWSLLMSVVSFKDGDSDTTCCTLEVIIQWKNEATVSWEGMLNAVSLNTKGVTCTVGGCNRSKLLLTLMTLSLLSRWTTFTEAQGQTGSQGLLVPGTFICWGCFKRSFTTLHFDNGVPNVYLCWLSKDILKLLKLKQELSIVIPNINIFKSNHPSSI